MDDCLREMDALQTEVRELEEAHMALKDKIRKLRYDREQDTSPRQASRTAHLRPRPQPQHHNGTDNTGPTNPTDPLSAPVLAIVERLESV